MEKEVECWFLNYVWSMQIPASILDVNQKQARVQQGEAWITLRDLHPFDFVRKVKDEEGVEIHLRNFFRISEEEYKLNLEKNPHAAFVSAEERNKTH